MTCVSKLPQLRFWSLRADQFEPLARELAEPYYLYGKALLELARAEDNVLGSRIPGEEREGGEEEGKRERRREMGRKGGRKEREKGGGREGGREKGYMQQTYV